MKNLESAIAKHYGDTELLSRIFAGLEEMGVDNNRLHTDDLMPVDEFHIGGRKATEYAIAKMSLNQDQHVLDIGCGIGGAARYIATHSGCSVTGIDLTPEYISTANTLTKLTGLNNKINHQVASALNMPFQDETFDAAITIHVAMNISDRVALYRETFRVMKPGATLCIFDVMKKSDKALTYPVPWAKSAETSHLTTPDEMQTLLADASFDLLETEDRTAFALDFFKQSLATTAEQPPPLGVHLVLGSDARKKLINTQSNIENGCIAPVQMIASRR